MKVRLQLVIIIFFLLFSILLFSALLKQSIHNRTDTLLQGKLTETRRFDIPKILDLNAASMKSFAYDYGVWDQTVQFLDGKRDTTWAQNELVLTLQRYKVDYIWVVDSNASKRYYSSMNTGRPVKELPILRGELKNYLQQSGPKPFFIQHNNAIVEIFIGAIRPTNDLRSREGARGYLILGRIVDDSYMANLQNLTNTLNFRLLQPNELYSDNSNTETGTLNICLPIIAWNGRVLGGLSVTRSYAEIKRYEDYLNWYSLAYICIIIIVAIGFYFLVKKIFLRPLFKLSIALQKNSTKDLPGLMKKKNEFGELAGLINDFFVQNDQLKEEVEIRKKSEADLVQALEQKHQAEKEKDKAEAFLEQQQALLTLNNDSYESSDEMMKAMIKVCAKTLNCDRASIWLYDEQKQSMTSHCIYELNSDQFLPDRTILEKDFPIYFQHLKKGVLICADNAMVHPALVELRHTHLKQYGINAVMDIAIRSGKQIRGVVCLEHVGEPRKWMTPEKEFAKSFSDLIATHITNDLKATERKLTKSQKRFEETQELAQIGSWEFSFFTQETIWSKEMYRIFEQPFDKEGKLSEVYKMKIHPEDLPGFEEALQSVIQNKTTGAIECRLICNDGSVKYILAMAEAIKSSNSGKTIGLQGTVQDITKQKQAALAKSEFLSCMSHEIRTPINGVIGIANLLQHETLSAKQMEYVKTLNFSAQHLSTLVSDILDFSKIEAGHLTFERVSFNLERNCREVFNLFLHKAKEKNLYFHFNPDTTNDFSLYGDYVRLNQVLSNLLTNAIKFTERGGVDFSYRIVSENRHNITICFLVKDTGIGISQEQQTHIFESFSQANESITRQYGGTGLGLTISKKLVELQGGSIDVKSIPGLGSEFSVELTFDKHVYDKEDIKHITTADKEVSKSLSGMKVLVAEDNHVNAMVLTSFLTKWNITSKIAKDGSEAVNLINDENFDMILMDIQMPNLDGIEATKIIRRSTVDRIKSTPVVAFTADASLDTHRELLKIGFDHCMTKPFNPETLFSFLKKSYSAS